MVATGLTLPFGGGGRAAGRGDRAGRRADERKAADRAATAGPGPGPVMTIPGLDATGGRRPARAGAVAELRHRRARLRVRDDEDRQPGRPVRGGARRGHPGARPASPRGAPGATAAGSRSGRTGSSTSRHRRHREAGAAPRTGAAWPARCCGSPRSAGRRRTTRTRPRRCCSTGLQPTRRGVRRRHDRTGLGAPTAPGAGDALHLLAPARAALPAAWRWPDRPGVGGVRGARATCCRSRQAVGSAQCSCCGPDRRRARSPASPQIAAAEPVYGRLAAAAMGPGRASLWLGTVNKGGRQAPSPATTG